MPGARSILIINGSPHKKGMTMALLKAVAEGIGNRSRTAGTDPDIEWVHVYDRSVQPCRGCLKCRPDKRCILPDDDAHRLATAIDDAAALVIGTPTYWGNMTGPLKTLLDRLVPTFEYIDPDGGIPKPKQKGKPAGIVITSNAPFPFNLLASQSRGATRAVKTVLKAGGYRIKSVVNLPGAGKYTPASIPDRYRSKARRLGAKL